ncbi:PREDICTED: uncharacterized protein LOC109585419 [Amphimedon queenslandica]|uniref:Uncharacterized protein n=1 Tax=Amphimedon queenslandica TaxID=400682 RepID=A0AAN0JJ49_AMPQE|nr:PREDICTED: uncharacterized protein LOC109585419 [Amphimedon queenslandica]|eukprot:XP_019857055.1 PREDICTED: uncharacterized protein LOC109585419 [Amphimedon queenslandica]
MFGRKAILPIDLQEGSTPSVPMNQDEIAEAIEVMTNNRIDIFENVKENIAKAQNKQKKLYDMKHSNPCKFKIGASVLVKDFRRKKRRGGKLDGRWLGPFAIPYRKTKVATTLRGCDPVVATLKFLYGIVEDCGKGFYRLKNRQKIIKRVNGAHLKIYKRPCNMAEDKLQVEQSEETSNCDSLQLNSITNETFKEDLQFEEFYEVSDPPLPPPLMKVSTSAFDDDLQPIRKRRKQIVQKKVIEVKNSAIPPPIMEPHTETSHNSASFVVIRRKKEQIFKDENEVCNKHSSTLIKLNTAPILSTTFAESLKSENSEVFSNTSLISLNGILSSTMVVNGRFIPPFFPDDVTCPVSPIKKQSIQISPVTEPLPNHHIVRPQPVKVRVTEPVKAIAFKKRQKKIEEVTKGSAIKIDLVTEKSPEKGRRVHYSSKTWVKKPLTMEDKDVLLKGKWLNDHLLDAGQEHMDFKVLC